MNRLYILILVLLLSCSIWAQERSFTSNIRFSQGHGNIEVAFKNNRESLDSLSVLLNEIKNDTTLLLTSIEIEAFTSPEGGKLINALLARKRCDAMEQYICGIIDIPDSLLKKVSKGVAWGRLRAMVASSEMSYRDMVLNIIDNYPELTLKDGIVINSRNKRLMDLKGGVPYNYMMEHFFPALRGAIAITISHKTAPIPVVEQATVVTPDTISQQKIDPIIEQPAIELQDNTPVGESFIESRQKKPLFALKTNLLFDLAMTPNIELEVPIGKRWSINAEFQRGWWLRKDDTFCWQIESGGLEGRYWFGDRNDRSILTGWFAGAFANGGFYDFQLKRNEGYQGEFYILAGLSGGYATPIARSLNLEFSLGVGYIITDYRHYHIIDNELIKHGAAMRFSSLFPAKAKVSLVWIINRTVKIKGRR